MIKTMKLLNLESLETRTLLAVGDVLDGEMADKVTDLAGKLVDSVFAGDMDKLNDAEALAKQYLGVTDVAEEAVASTEVSEGEDDAEPKKKKSRVKKLTSFFEKIPGSIGDAFDKITGSDAEDEATEDAKAEDSTAEGEKDDSEGLLDRVGDVFDTVGDAFDHVTNIFGGSDPDQELDDSSARLSGILDRVHDRIRAFGGEDSPAGGKIGLAAAHLMDVTGEVIDSLTGFIDDATDSSPEREQRIETALKIAAAALEGVSGVSSLVGVAVPGVSAVAPALNAASDVLENASSKSSTVVKAAEKVGNTIGSVGHKAASLLDTLSDKLDPTADDADEVVAVDGEVSPEAEAEVIALNATAEVLVA